jgi:hypothetical protein
MSDGQILKPDKDFSKEVDKQIPEAEELAKVELYAITPLAEVMLILRFSQMYKLQSKNLRH